MNYNINIDFPKIRKFNFSFSNNSFFHFYYMCDLLGSLLEDSRIILMITLYLLKDARLFSYQLELF